MDQATRLLQHASFDHDTAIMLCRVLEEGCAEMQPRCKGAPAQKANRLNLADAILALAKVGQRDPAALKFYAVSRAHMLLAR